MLPYCLHFHSQTVRRCHKVVIHGHCSIHWGKRWHLTSWMSLVDWWQGGEPRRYSTQVCPRPNTQPVVGRVVSVREWLTWPGTPAVVPYRFLRYTQSKAGPDDGAFGHPLPSLGSGPSLSTKSDFFNGNHGHWSFSSNQEFMFKVSILMHFRRLTF